MNTTLLLAKSLVRQNRWLLLAFALWPLLMGALVWSPHRASDRGEVLEIMQQEVFYGVAVVAFLASAAIYNEKRSRRIVGVLSKAVSRGEYLDGLLLGCAFFAFAYFLAVGISLVWLLGHSVARFELCLNLLLHGFIASLWIAALSLLFSTLCYPFIAAAMAGAAAFAPLALSHSNVILAPAARLMEAAGSLAVAPDLKAIFVAVAECLIFLFLAAQIFASRDVTVSIE